MAGYGPEVGNYVYSYTLDQTKTRPVVWIVDN